MRPVPVLVLALAVAVALLFLDPLRGMVEYLMGRTHGGYSVAQRLDQFGALAEGRLRPAFEAAGVAYPPAEVALLGFKDSRSLEVYARADGRWRFVKAYRVLAASGWPGPKLRDGRTDLGGDIMIHGNSVSVGSPGRRAALGRRALRNASGRAAPISRQADLKMLQ
jgi:hypothetical protein